MLTADIVCKGMTKIEIIYLIINTSISSPIHFWQSYFGRWPGEREVSIIEDVHVTFDDNNPLLTEIMTI